MSDLGQRIRKRRETLGLSLEAAATGVCSKAHLWNIEHGGAEPTAAIVGGLARRFRLSTDLLLGVDLHGRREALRQALRTSPHPRSNAACRMAVLRLEHVAQESLAIDEPQLFAHASAKLARCFAALGDHTRAVWHLEDGVAALACTTDARARARLQLYLAHLLTGLGRPGDARRVVAAALRQLGESPADHGLRANLHLASAEAALEMRAPADAAADVDAAEAPTRYQRRPADEDAEWLGVRCTALRARVLARLGELKRSADLAERLLLAGDRQSSADRRARLRHWSGQLAYLHDRLEPARSLLQQTFHAYRDRHDPWGPTVSAECAADLALVLTAQRRHGLAAELCALALARWGNTCAPVWRARLQLLRSQCKAALGEYTEAFEISIGAHPEGGWAPGAARRAG